MSSRWHQIWDDREAPPEGSSTLGRLMAAGGLDSGFANVGEDAFAEFALRMADRLEMPERGSVFDVGCGAGSFVYELWRRGHAVGGIDRASKLVALASEVMPGSDFAVADAAELSPDPPADAVASMGVFLYFPSLDYARKVIEQMVAKARVAVAVLDVPDLDRRDEDLAFRQARAGGPEAYAERYAGLEHRYYHREWVRRAFEDAGLVRVQVADQEIAGYGNSPFRFNVWGFVSTNHQ